MSHPRTTTIEAPESSGLAVESVDVHAYTVPTDGPGGEVSDGTLTWISTTLVTVEIGAGGRTGLGYTYADVSAASLAESMLAPRVEGADPFAIGALWHELDASLRNTGRPGIGALALSAVDLALRDLKAKPLGLPLFRRTALSAHCAPSASAHAFCAVRHLAPWSTSTTTSASRACCSTAPSPPQGGYLARTRPGPASASRPGAATRSAIGSPERGEWATAGWPPASANRTTARCFLRSLGGRGDDHPRGPAAGTAFALAGGVQSNAPREAAAPQEPRQRRNDHEVWISMRRYPLFGNMKLENLEKLYVDELKDAYDFEHQILDALPKMEESAKSPELKAAFREHRSQTENQVRRLEQVFNHLGQDAERKTCKGMKGVIGEGEEYVKAKGDEATIDAALISAAQRVEHYEMAVYGTLRTYANALGHQEQANLLQQTLDEEADTDEKLTRLAESGINVEAAVPAE